MSARTSRSLCFSTALALLAAAASARAAPAISSISLRGLKAGGTTRVVIEGTELLPDAHLLSTAPIKQVLKPGGSPQRIEMEITVDVQTPPGIYLLRLASASGVSSAVAVGIDGIAQIPFTPQVAALPVSLTGSLVGSNVLVTSFAGKAGQRIVADVESRRLGASLNPVLHLYNSRRVQLAWSQAIPAIAGDARCEAVLPRDGQYTVELHDALYRATGPGFFRLKIGDLHYADVVFPLGVTRGDKAALEYDLPTKTQPLGAADVSLAGVHPAPWPVGVARLTGSRPRVIVSDYAEAIERPQPAGQLQQVAAAPVAINGRLGAKGEVDRYRLPVTPGQRLQFDVLASRAGSPLDGVLSILDEQGRVLSILDQQGHEIFATNDDRPDTKDPGLEWVVPPGLNALVVSLRDLRGAGGPNYIYRIVIQPSDQPDFALSLAEDRQLVPRNSVGVMRVRAERRHYNGPIKLSFQGMPAPVTAAGDEIPAGASESLVSLTAGDVNPTAGVIAIAGESVGLAVPLKRTALAEPNQVSRQQPWLGGEIAVAVVGPTPLAIAWEEPSADAKFLAGSSFAAGVRVDRAAGTQGPVKLSIISSQPMPKKTMRVGGRDQLVDDPDRLLRIEGTPTLAAAESQAKFKIIAPAELAPIPYDLVVKGELLAADGKSVLASAVTPARRLAAERPLVLEVAGEHQIAAPAGLGPSGKISGKIARKAGFVFPATISLTGLPAGVASPLVAVPADKSEFELEAAFAYGTPTAELANVRVLATSQIDPKDATAIVHSNEVPISLNIVAGTKPPAQKPFVIFEDQPEFLTNLTQGNGTASLLSDEKYSGEFSVKVTPDQRSNAMLPGLNVKIRQHPSAPDEYRYVQFAWKKLLGESICLQLAHDGQFGPVPGNPAKFRYHAGGGECLGASVSVAPAIPGVVTLVTRDLFDDFGEFTLTGIGLAPIDGDFGLYDHIYLGKTPSDFDMVAP